MQMPKNVLTYSPQGFRPSNSTLLLANGQSLRLSLDTNRRLGFQQKPHREICRGFKAQAEKNVKSILTKSAFWFLLGTLWVAGATAWAQPRISVHPLMVEQTRLGERWNAFFMREVARHNVAMTPEPLVEEFLEQHAGSCKNDTECLRQLGYATKAHYVISGGMYRTENAHMVYVNVMLVDGTSVKKVGPLRVERISKTSEEANIMAAYKPLFEELKLESLNPHPEVPLEAPVVIIPPPVEIPVEVQVPVILTPTGFKQHDKVVAELKTHFGGIWNCFVYKNNFGFYCVRSDKGHFCLLSGADVKILLFQ
jgi:hypothetical protein